ncbi:MAG TPA: DeoR/GlpR family DNA-binding transcription regulator [Burkholderiaceae bacterium]
MDNDDLSHLAIYERRNLIRDLVAERGKVTVDELVERFGVSAVSIRSDLKALHHDGALVRVRGGAVMRRDDEDLPISVKENLHHAEKVRIAELAAKMIEDGDTVILDSGTTTAELAKKIRTLKMASINVITNALNIAVILAGCPHVTVIMLGGVLRPNSFSLSGPQAEHALESLYADKLFLGGDSLDPELGLMTPYLLEAQLNAKMIQIAKQVVVVADSSKLMRRNLSVIAKFDQVDVLITDSAAQPATIKSIRAHGVDVQLV